MFIHVAAVALDEETSGESHSYSSWKYTMQLFGNTRQCVLCVTLSDSI